MPLLIIPLVLVLALVAVVVLLPFGLVQRYRSGSARRPLRPWLLQLNAWLLVLSVVLFLGGAALSSLWIAGAFVHGALGLLAGVALGIAGLWIARFERTPSGEFVTPNRALALALVLLLAARIALGIWQAVGTAPDPATLAPWQAWLLDHAQVFAFGGLLLGYYAGHAWTLHRRVSARRWHRVD